MERTEMERTEMEKTAIEKTAISVEKVNTTVRELTRELEDELNNINQVDKYDILRIRKEIDNFLQQYRNENRRKNQGYSKELENKMVGYSQLLKNEFHKKFKDEEYKNPKVEKEVVDKLKEYGLKNKEISELTGISEISIKRLSGDTKSDINKEKGRPKKEYGIYLFDNLGNDEEERKYLIKVYQEKFRDLYNIDDGVADALEKIFDKDGHAIAEEVNNISAPISKITGKPELSGKTRFLRNKMQKAFKEIYKRMREKPIKENGVGGNINIDNISNLEDFTEDIDNSPEESDVIEKKQDMRDKYRREDKESFAFLDLNDLMKFANI